MMAESMPWLKIWGEPMILRPEGGPANHWMSFQLEGVTCALR
jgi:hypothetical protein